MMMNKLPPATFSRPGRKAWLRRFIALLVVMALLASALFSIFAPPVAAKPLAQVDTDTPTITPTAPSNIVISEFRTRGPDGGNDEFIEIFNPTDSIVDISGWKIWGWSAPSTQSVRFP